MGLRQMKRPAEKNKWQKNLVDARSDLILHITEGDIKGAKKKDSDACAAANAICRQLHIKEAKVFKTKTYVLMKNGIWVRYCTPRSLYSEIIIFDRGGNFEAGDYILKAPTNTQRLGYHPKPKGKIGKTGKPSRPFHITAGTREHAPHGHSLFNILHIDGGLPENVVKLPVKKKVA